MPSQLHIFTDAAERIANQASIVPGIEVMDADTGDIYRRIATGWIDGGTGSGPAQNSMALMLGILDANGDPKTVLSNAGNGFIYNAPAYAGYASDPPAAITETPKDISYASGDNVTALLVHVDGDATNTGVMIGLNFVNLGSAQAGMRPTPGNPPTAGNQYFFVDKAVGPGYVLINPGVLITRIWALGIGSAVNRTEFIPL